MMKPRPQAPHSPLPSGITRTASLRARFDSFGNVTETVTNVKG